MTEETKVMKNVAVVDKAIKETATGKKFLKLDIKENPTDKYPKTMSYFPPDGEEANIDQIKKGSIVDLTYTEKAKELNGKTTVFKNIVSITNIGEVSEAQIEKLKSNSVDEIAEAVVYTGQIATAVKEVWIENFLKDGRLEDIPPQELVSIFSTLFIQTCRQVGG